MNALIVESFATIVVVTNKYIFNMYIAPRDEMEIFSLHYVWKYFHIIGLKVCKSIPALCRLAYSQAQR